jgi:hypothetical protein
MSFRFLFGGRLPTARAMCVCCMIIVEVIYYITIYNIDNELYYIYYI